MNAYQKAKVNRKEIEQFSNLKLYTSTYVRSKKRINFEMKNITKMASTPTCDMYHFVSIAFYTESRVPLVWLGKLSILHIKFNVHSTFYDRSHRK